MSEFLQTILHTATTHSSGGRTGSGRSSDGLIDVLLGTPGSATRGTNPEQLFGMGYSACFNTALQIAAARQGVPLPKATSVDAEVTLGRSAAGDLQLAIRLSAHLPDLGEDVQRTLLAAAHRICPYSRMTRGYVEVDIAAA